MELTVCGECIPLGAPCSSFGTCCGELMCHGDLGATCIDPAAECFPAGTECVDASECCGELVCEGDQVLQCGAPG